MRSQWCWAAAISGVFAFYGHPVSQARIVQQAYGGVVNMPGSPQAIMASLNRPWVDDAGVSFRVTADVYSANWVTAAQDLAQNQPLIVGSLGHAMVVTATEYWRMPNGAGQTQFVTVRDPWPTNPRRRQLTPREASGVQMLIRIRVTRAYCRAWRERVGIEPTSRLATASPVLKTGRATRPVRSHARPSPFFAYAESPW